MKSWLVILLVLLALVVLVSPGIVGRLAERNLESSIEWAEQEGQDVVVTEQTFARGWFTSEGRQRVELRNEQLRSIIDGIAGPAANGRPPALIIDTHLDHGIIPVTSMSRDSGSLRPGLASAVSTVKLDPGDGRLIELPGRIHSRIGLSGASVSRYALEPGSFKDGSTRIEWSGVDATVSADPSDLSLRFEAAVEPLRIDSGDSTMTIGKTRLDGTQRQTSYGFNTGSIDLDMEAVSMATPGGAARGFEKLTLAAGTELVGERVNGQSQMNVIDIGVPGFGEIDLSMAVAVNRLDAQSMRAILAAVEEAQASRAPEEALAAIYPQIEDDVQRFMAAGAEIRIDRLDVELPQGPVRSKLRLDLAETDPANFTWPGVLLALSATADVRLPAALVEMAQAANPQAGVLVAMGILQKDGDFYQVNAEYAKGLLTVNGAPMPIPLPGR